MHRTLRARSRHSALTIGACGTAVSCLRLRFRGADQPTAPPPPMFKQYCLDCHGNNMATAGISLEKLTAAPPVAENYQVWQRRESHLPLQGLSP